jgi:hypothetical protein
MTYGRPRPPPMTTPSSPQTTSLSLPRPRHPKQFVWIARQSRQLEFAHRGGGGGRPRPHRICTCHRYYCVLLVDRATTMPSLTIDDGSKSSHGVEVGLGLGVVVVVVVRRGGWPWPRRCCCRHRDRDWTSRVTFSVVLANGQVALYYSMVTLATAYPRRSSGEPA